MVNIPEFMLHISEADTHVLHMRVVVGKEVRINGQAADDAPEGYGVGAMTVWLARRSGDQQ